MSTIIGAETTVKVETQPLGKIIAYWVKTPLLAFVVGSGGIGELSHRCSDHYRVLESAWDDRHPPAGSSAAHHMH